MKGKIAFVLGAAVGYVLGTRAGRERYEQIKRGAQTVWETDAVQRGVGAVRGVAQDRIEDVKDTAVRLGKDLFASLVHQGEGSDQAGAREGRTAARKHGSASGRPGTTQKPEAAIEKAAAAKAVAEKPAAEKPAGEKPADRKPAGEKTGARADDADGSSGGDAA